MKKICCPFTSWIMAQPQGLGRRYIKAFFKGFFVAVPVTVTFLDRVACVARVEGASMQPSLNPGERQVSDVVLLNHWSIRNYEVQRGDIVSLVSPKNPEQKIIKRVIALEGDIVKFLLGFYMLMLPISCGLQGAGRSYNLCCPQNVYHFTVIKNDLHVHDGEMKY
ncbi:mitochondrial inner membrane protease subunit 2 isoform X3 [Dermochelys coriacea]|uniref:mitochondrial inner membrane protease subunit 2 isoform X3 n=1 Tax=Dermochelys coriacea TaxID=27794 RepID=UPI001CA8562F|nr:mitochondrial inner membrane protease subunit 2 isoform X3 [Dermochelys coriacea]